MSKPVTPLTRQKLGELAEHARNWTEHATPYQIARMEARGSIGNLARNWSIALQPWNDNRAVTVIAGKSRHTREGHEAQQPRARDELGLLVAALREPENADSRFLGRYMSVSVAIFALSPEDRMELADEYQKVLDTYDAR